ncbi:hypothetical protein FRC10_007631 [Ceratobasidium sp. 414]|nr:hypothetical protein FRC10_007631 [Ceratobasidium sp. 414]
MDLWRTCDLADRFHPNSRFPQLRPQNFLTLEQVFTMSDTRPPKVTVTEPTPRIEPAHLNMSPSQGQSRSVVTPHHEEDESLFKRSVHAVSDLFSPFSSTALASLPRNPVGFRERSTRIDRIPDSNAPDGVPNYQSVASQGPSQSRVRVRVPKKVATPIKVETKVWLANERSE